MIIKTIYMKTISINIQDNTYQGLKKITGQRQISQFVDKLITEEIERKKQKLIEDYKSFAHSKAMREEDKI